MHGMVVASACVFLYVFVHRYGYRVEVGKGLFGCAVQYVPVYSGAMTVVFTLGWHHN